MKNPFYREKPLRRLSNTLAGAKLGENVVIIDHTARVGSEEDIYKLLEMEDEAHVDKVVVMPWYAPFPRNKQLAQLIVGHEARDRLIGSAWINPYADNAVEELRDLIQKWAFKDLKLMPTSHYFRLEGDIVHPLMREAHKLRIPVTIHSDGILGQPLAFGVLAEVFPDVPIIMEHMGYRHPEPVWGFEQAFLVAKKHDNVYLDITGILRSNWVKVAVDAVGADRIIFGTAAPGGNPRQCVETVKLAGLTEKDEALVLGDTIAKLYGIRNGNNKT